MDPVLVGVFGLVASLALIAIRVPIAFALGSMALVCIGLFFAFPAAGGSNIAGAVTPAMTLVSRTMFSLFNSYDLAAIPLFVALGHVCYRAGITSDIYIAARAWLTRIPGGLAMASVVGCGGFSAISGSSLACAATMGRVAVPEMMRYGYSDRLATGSVAAGGTLGSLIPPGILFILYGVFAEQSISKLFIAGVIPGIISIIGYCIVIAIWTAWKPGAAPRGDITLGFSAKLAAVAGSWPALLLFVIIIGGIYGGVFTATEAAAVSFLASVVIAFALRRITLVGFWESMKETAYQTAALFLIAAAAKTFVTFVSLTGVAHAMVDAVTAFEPSPAVLILGIVGIYLIMGMFLDPLGILLLTLPFVVPLVEAHGFDLIWFGVIVVKLLEMGLITPPVGLNVFVINSVTDPKVPVGRIFAGVMPFFGMDIIVLGLLLLFPILSLWLTTAI